MVRIISVANIGSKDSDQLSVDRHVDGISYPKESESYVSEHETKKIVETQAAKLTLGRKSG